jgi:hypothetical protein
MIAQLNHIVHRIAQYRAQSKAHDTSMAPLTPLHLTIMASEQKKLIDPNTRVICCDNINSGACTPHRYIVVWRYEELYKVLVHELIHFHGIDFHYTDPMYDQLDQMLELPRVQGIDRLNESYTETLAVLVLAVHGNVTRDYDIRTLLRIEAKFLMFQTAKIIRMMGGKCFADYLDGTATICQTTSFRSYFIIKLMLLCNIDGFVRFLANRHDSNRGDSNRGDSNRGDSNRDDGFKISGNHRTKMLEYGHLVNQSFALFCANPRHVAMIDRYIKQIAQSDPSGWIVQTARMSSMHIVP